MTTSGSPIMTRYGLELLPEPAENVRDASYLPAPSNVDAASSLPAALQGIAARYDGDTAAFVALQLEYPWPR